MKIILPWPPSLNHYYVRARGRTYIGQRGREYRRRVCNLLAPHRDEHLHRTGRIAVALDAYPPDRRRRDLDNLQKCAIDSMEHAGLFEDDSQIDVLLTRRGRVCGGGELGVTILDLPLRHCLMCGQELISKESEQNHVG